MPEGLEQQGRELLRQLLPGLEARFRDDHRGWGVFERRLQDSFPLIFECLVALYGRRADFFGHLGAVLATAADGWLARPASLRALDREREQEPEWFSSNRQVGGVCYVDRFAGTLDGVRERIPYFRELGLTYLHLMPLFLRPPPPNDGGYAVSSYREIEPGLGTMSGLRRLADDLRRHGISLVIDFVLNHTADDHAWAVRAKAGDDRFQAFYFMFDDRTLPDRYQANLRAIFPDRGGDSFVWRADVAGPRGGKWVWSTFYPFQWDLNFANPAVFTAILGEMLYLANQGIEFLRLDAVPFLWKELGTTCENRPQAHQVVQALNALTDVAAPALAFKSEAIVHPDEVTRYISIGECHLSYNPLLMVLLWEALATREVKLLRHALEKRFAVPEGTTWVNYLRCHDDIGWGFADEDATEVGIKGFDHRQFLNRFYTGAFPGSFACGLPFQENPRTGDCRICGTLASLAGLEQALESGDAWAIELAVRRVLMLHGVIFTIGGIPLIYFGDEIGQLNDYGFRHDPAKVLDNRWVHRPAFDWRRLQQLRRSPRSARARIFHGLKHLIALRKMCPALSHEDMRVLPIGDRHILAFLRKHGHERVVVLANLSEHQRSLPARELRHHGGARRFRELVSEQEWQARSGEIAIEPYQFACLHPLRA